MPESERVTLPAYLQATLSAIAREAPLQFAELKRALDVLIVRVVVNDATPFSFQLSGEPPWVTANARANLEVRIDETTLAALAGGECSIEAALEAGGLIVYGSADDAARLADALRAWIHGALRSPSVPKLQTPQLVRSLA